MTLPESLQFPTLARTTLSRQVANAIKDRIENGDIPPKTRLPSERRLSDAFGVSRVAVREAVQLLQAKRYVEVRAGKGIFIVDPDLRTASTLESWVGERDARLEMMVELRMAIEPGIAALAAEKGTPDGAAALMAEARALEQGPERDASATDGNFHRTIGIMTGNDLIVELLSACLDKTEPLRIRTLQDARSRHLAAQGHMAIAKAIGKGDPNAAQRAMLSHLIDARASLYPVTTGDNATKGTRE